MGCTTSKLDDLPAVALCRYRCDYLAAAIQQRYALAESHAAYTHSLKEIGPSLHQFINHQLRVGSEDDDDSPKTSKTKLTVPATHSDSGSGHLEFDSDSDEIDSLHHSDHSSPLHPMGLTDYTNSEVTGSDPYFHMNYMKNSSIPPSIVYEQRPSSPKRVYIGESSNANFNPYLNPTNSSNPYFGYPNYRTGSSSTKPLPPPPPPKSEAWDFMNLFDYAPYELNQDTREVREEEDIPDLEEDDFHHEVVKEIQGNQKFAVSNAPIPTVDDKEAPPVLKDGTGQTSQYQTRPSVSVEKEEREYEVHVVEKKVVAESKEDVRRSNAAASGSGGGVRRGVTEIAKEIEIQFLKAAESGSEIAVMLEVGKHPHGRKHGTASSKMVTPSRSMVSSSQPSTSKKAEASSSATPPTYADIEAELALRSRNLSSTLHKLYLWEKKLYVEVKAEEKLRIEHENKLRKLKRMDERGADAQKVNSTRGFVRSLSTKIRIAIQVVDKVSITINKIRDEELWLQLHELIKGFSKMWKSMFECHQSQCKAIKEARGLGSIRAGQNLGDDHLEATRLLVHELINWMLGFSSWVNAQKGFVRELNSWLMKCLIYEPEETPDGIVPFSPGRIGAPMIFVIVNQWEQAMERISEKAVIEAMRSFTMSVLHLWEQGKLETHERTMGHGESRNMVEQRIQKEIQELERKIAMVGPPGEDNIIHQRDGSNENLRDSLRRIFEAMERFAEESMRAYEDLLERATEEEHSSIDSEDD